MNQFCDFHVKTALKTTSSRRAETYSSYVSISFSQLSLTSCEQELEHYENDPSQPRQVLPHDGTTRDPPRYEFQAHVRRSEQNGSLTSPQRLGPQRFHDVRDGRYLHDWSTLSRPPPIRRSSIRERIRRVHTRHPRRTYCPRS